MPTTSPRRAVYPGVFDPVHYGHLDVIQRGSRIFERLIVGVGENPDKFPLFDQEERVGMLRECVVGMTNVEVQPFVGLAVRYVRSLGARIMLRGIRTVSDLESEFTMALANHTLAPQVETVFLMANEKYSHISSTLIRQIARMGQGSAADKLRQFVPEPVIAPLLEKSRRHGPPSE